MNQAVEIAHACFTLLKDYSGVTASLLRDASGAIEQSLVREAAMRSEVETLAADKALLDCWDDSGSWLIGITSAGCWQGMCQKPGMVGSGVVGDSVRDVLRQIRDIEIPV